MREPVYRRVSENAELRSDAPAGVGVHVECFSICSFWLEIPNPMVLPIQYCGVIEINVSVDYSCSAAWWQGVPVRK